MYRTSSVVSTSLRQFSAQRLLPRVASLHCGRPTLLQSTKKVDQYPPDEAPALRPTDKVAQFHPSRMHGSYHWDLERVLSVATLGLMAAPFAIGAGNSIVDLGLAFVLPAHIHMGLDGVIRDYAPYRKFGFMATAARWVLKFITAGVVYGAYQFNTNDIGITEYFRRLWHADKVLVEDK